MPLLEWLANSYKKFGCQLEFVTNKSQVCIWALTLPAHAPGLSTAVPTSDLRTLTSNSQPIVCCTSGNWICSWHGCQLPLLAPWHATIPVNGKRS